MKKRFLAFPALFAFVPAGAWAVCPYDVNCLDNPYGGRGDSTAPFNPAPYGRGQVSPAFGANPLRGGSQYDPYATIPRPDDPQAAPAPGSLGAGPPTGPDGLQGLDPDHPK